MRLENPILSAAIAPLLYTLCVAGASAPARSVAVPIAFGGGASNSNKFSWARIGRKFSDECEGIGEETSATGISVGTGAEGAIPIHWDAEDVFTISTWKRPREKPFKSC